MTVDTAIELDNTTAMLGEVVHTTCCLDEYRTALCGKDVSAELRVPMSTPASCAGCIVADYNDICPLTGKVCDE